MANFNFNELKLTDPADITKVDENFKEIETKAAPLANPIFTGNPKAPNPSDSSEDETISTTYFVQRIVKAVKNALETTINSLSTVVSGKANTTTYNTTIENTGWEGSTAPFTKNISVSGIVSNDNPIIDIVQSGVFANDENLIAEWSKITRIVSGENILTVTANAIPTVNIPIQIKVVK